MTHKLHLLNSAPIHKALSHFFITTVVTSKNGCPSGSSTSSSSSHHNNNPNPSSDARKYVSTTSNFKGSPPSLVNFEFHGNHYIENMASGILSSSVAMETGVGTDRCPWIFILHPLHQRLYLTFRQFTNHNSGSTVTVEEFSMASNQGDGDYPKVSPIYVSSGQSASYTSVVGAVKVLVAFSTTTYNHRHHRRHRDVRQEMDEAQHKQEQRGVQEDAAVLIEFQGLIVIFNC